MEISEMKHEDIERRLSAIQEELKDDNADVECLSKEVDELEERQNYLLKQADEKRALIEKVNNANVPVIEERKEETKKMENKDMIYDALAETIKGHATPEQRALLTENVNGTVAINKIVDDYIWTDWEKSGILSRIRKHYVPGNYAVQYEASATGAVKHTEGTNAPEEEQLVLGTVAFLADYYKKWIDVTDSVLALRGRAFLDYLRDEFNAKLADAIEDGAIAEIEASTLTAKVTHAIDKGAVLAGLAQLSDEARNPVAIMSRSTWATIKADALDGNYAYDPFEGLEVLFNSTVTGVLVGDLDGVIANFPEGEDFKFIVDELSHAHEDKIRITGKVLCAVHLVRPNGFVSVTNA